MNPRIRALYMERAETAGKWYLHNQCTDKNPWGPVHNLADEGRFVYEVYKGTRWSRAVGVWGQAMGIMDLIDLGEATGNDTYSKAAQGGSRYLKALQCLDFRYPVCQGAFWEHVPCGPMGYIRDGATGAFGLTRLYQHTGEKEYLERAKLWCDWLIKHGSKKEYCWPYETFDFNRRVAHSMSGAEIPGLEGSEPEGVEEVDGDWQSGCGLALYYTALLSGEDRYLEEGLKPMLEKVVNIYDQYGDDPAQAGWHGQTPVTYGNDDFALIALVAGYRLWKDERYLRHIKNRIRTHLGWMADDGSYPNFEAVFVCSIEHLEYLRLADEFGFTDMVDEVRTAVWKSAEHTLTLQERQMNDPMYYGGLYGQNSYGVSRDRIHHRATGYSINFNLKLVGTKWPPSFSSYGWGKM